MDPITHTLNAYTIAAMRWSSPWWWLCAAMAIFILGMINILPLSVPPAKEEEYGFHEVWKILLRKLCLGVLVFLVLVFWPAMYFATIGALAATAAQGHAWFMDYVSRQALHWGWLLPLSGVVGFGSRICFERYARPFVSRFIQNHVMIKQADEKQTDMRVEFSKLKTRDFEPRKFYKKSEIFLGLDIDNKPVYLGGKTYRETHMQVVGPTRFGKGVLLGVMLEQAILQGNSVIYIDPKADKFVPYIMADACEKAGKRMVYIDLASEDTKWAPFEGGTDRDRRSRIIACFGLANSGDAGDFYKAKERAILDTIMPRSGTSIAGLKAALEMKGDDGKPLKENANRLYDSLVEFGAMPSLNPKKGGGNKIGDALKAGHSIYLRGSLDDTTVKRATQTFLSECIQEARRLAPERTTHLTLAIDELKFMISQEVSDALATIAGFNVNMILLHQSLEDLKGPEDRSLNVDAIGSSVLVNCQIKLLYRASDPETAEWASLLSGTKIIKATKSQTVEANRYYGETFNTPRIIYDLEVPIISMNEMLSLSPRVGVFFVPERLATVIFTCFVSANTKRVLYQRPQDKAAEGGDAAPAAPAQAAPPAAKPGAKPQAPAPAAAQKPPAQLAAADAAKKAAAPVAPAAAQPKALAPQAQPQSAAKPATAVAPAPVSVPAQAQQPKPAPTPAPVQPKPAAAPPQPQAQAQPQPQPKPQAAQPAPQASTMKTEPQAAAAPAEPSASPQAAALPPQSQAQHAPLPQLPQAQPEIVPTPQAQASVPQSPAPTPVPVPALAAKPQAASAPGAKAAEPAKAQRPDFIGPPKPLHLRQPAAQNAQQKPAAGNGQPAKKKAKAPAPAAAKPAPAAEPPQAPSEVAE